MINPTIRNWATPAFSADGYAPVQASAATLATRSVALVQLILSNTSGSDVLVTIKDGDGNIMVNYLVAAGDVYTRQFEQGWKYNKGITIYAATGSVVRYELLGFSC